MARSYAEEDGGVRQQRESGLFDCPVDELIAVQIVLLFLTRNTSATNRMRRNALSFLRRFDIERHRDNPAVYDALVLARAVGEATVEHNAGNIVAVQHRVLENTDHADHFAEFFERYRSGEGFVADGIRLENELSNTDVRFVDDWISTRSRFSVMWQERHTLRKLADEMEAEDMGQIGEYANRYLETLETITRRMRSVRALNAFESQDFSTSDGSFEAMVRATIAVRRKPQAVIRTGVHKMNELLGGGYEGGRVYVHFGRSGDWKSGQLCSAAFWAVDPRLNPQIVTSDPTRRPCVLFITQENDVYETIERMCSYALGSHVDFRSLNDEEAITVARQLVQSFSTDICDFEFRYRPSRSIDCTDIDAWIQELYTNNKEVVMVVQDYIKRAKAIEKHKERHLELGAIVDEFSALAKRYNVPFVTGMQLNREAYAKFEQAIQAGKLDAVRTLGESNVGESINVLENADCVIFQGRVKTRSGGKLLQTYRRAKMRGKRSSNLEFFAHPFEVMEDGETNEMKLVIDAHLDPRLSKSIIDIADFVAKDYDANGDVEDDDRDTSGLQRTGKGKAAGKTTRRASAAAAVLNTSRPTAHAAPEGGGTASGSVRRTQRATAVPPPEGTPEPAPWEDDLRAL